jgi:hypothetical protein
LIGDGFGLNRRIQLRATSAPVLWMMTLKPSVNRFGYSSRSPRSMPREMSSIVTPSSRLMYRLTSSSKTLASP